MQVVEAQAAKPQPSAAVITSKLEGIAKVLAAAGGVAVAAQKLLPMAQQALEWQSRCSANHDLSHRPHRLASGAQHQSGDAQRGVCSAGVGGRYDALPTAPADVAQVVRGLPARGYRGVNVTIPTSRPSCR
ncbi:MAG: hypothetical protein R2844_08530 [Caldilineales bacterium]